MAHHVDAGPSPAIAGAQPGEVRFGVLGPVRVEVDGHELHVAGSHRRRLLALLASRAGQTVSQDAIVDGLWDDDPPASAVKTVHAHVLRLRRSLGDDLAVLVETVPGGYRLGVEPEQIDAVRFERLVARTRAQLAAGDPRAAVSDVEAALALWRGTAYGEFPDTGFAAAERVRLEELRSSAVELLAEGRLIAGEPALALADLERVVAEQPGREEAWSLLMRALYASGRQHDALDAFQRARRALADSFGLDPGAELVELERRILAQDPTLTAVAGSGRLPAALRVTGRLVGRAEELAWLHDGWTAARRGDGQIRAVWGPVDVGRTRLVAELARHVVTAGGQVEYVRSSTGFGPMGAREREPGTVVDVVADRCRRAPLLLVVDDVEWASPDVVECVDALTAAAAGLELLLVVIGDPTGGGPVIEALRRLPAPSRELGPLSPADVEAIVNADGVTDPDAVAAAAAISGGLPGVARREAAVWAERAASDRLQRAAATSIDAGAAADDARATVFDEVLALVAARARRDETLSRSWIGRQPYRSLDFYGPEDADLYVGRERLVAELAARVIERRLVAVVGASGSGKSSLVRAGLVPLVRSGRLTGDGPWRATVIVPGHDPLASFDAVAELDAPGRQLLVVDQFEEVLNSGVADAVARRLVDLVLDAAVDVHVVVVVRADQMGALAASRQLAELVEDAQVLVGPPTEAEIRRIVEVPARRTGCIVDPALVARVVADVAGHDAALPLVSAALAEVWQQREGEVLTLQHYLEVGGIAAAVERLGHAAMVRAGEARVRAVMLRLVDVTDDGRWTRRRITLDEIPATLSTAVDALVEARLVRRDGENLDVVHEVVFDAWPRLTRWLEDARNDLVVDREVRLAAKVWDLHGRSDDDVYRGARLAAASEHVARADGLPPVVHEFVAAGHRLAHRDTERTLAQLQTAQRARRRLSVALTAVGVLLVLALVGGALALDARRRADAERRTVAAQRDAATVARLVAESGRELDHRLDLALLLAVEARRRADTIDSRGALLSALTHATTAWRTRTGSSATDAVPIVSSTSSLSGFLSGPHRYQWRYQWDADVSTDGRFVAVSGSGQGYDDGLLLIFDTETMSEVGRLEADTVITNVDLAGEGTFALALEMDGDAHRIDLASGQDTLLDSGETASDLITEIMLLPDDRRAVLHERDGDLILWDLDAMRPLGVEFEGADFGTLVLAPDGSPALIEPGPAFTRWDAVSGEVAGSVALEPIDAPIDMWAIAGDWSVVAGAEWGGRLHLWDAESGELIGDAAFRPGMVTSIAFDPAAPSILAIATFGGGITLFDVQREQPVGETMLQRGPPMYGLAFAHDGSSLVSISDDGLVITWGRDDASGLISRTVPGGGHNPSYSTDGRRVAVHVGGPRDGRTEVRDASRPAEPGLVVRTPSGHTSSSDALLSADGALVVAWDAGDSPGLFVADAETGEPVWSQTDDDFEASQLATFSADGTRLIAVDSSRRSLRMWDLASGAVVGRTTLPTATNDPPNLTEDGRYVDVATAIELLRFDAATLEELVSIPVPPGTELGSVDDVPGTQHVITTAAGGRVLRWDMSTGALVASGQSRVGTPLTSVTVSDDGTLVAAYHATSFLIALFDAETLKPIGEPFPVGDLYFTPWFLDGGRMLVGNGLYNELTMWDLDPDSWQATACRAAGRNLSTREWTTYFGDTEPYRATCPEWPVAA